MMNEYCDHGVSLMDTCGTCDALQFGPEGAPTLADLRSQIETAEAELDEAREIAAEPVLVVLFCPLCKVQHIDEGEWRDTRRHKTHRCVDGRGGKGCGHEWRPAAVDTIGCTFADLEP